MPADMNLARHYRTLGLRPGSSGREIKAAYRQLVRRYHPDINPDKQAVERFIKINDAYTAISEVTQARARRSHQYSTYSVHQSTTPPDSTHHKEQKTPSSQSSQSTDQVEAAVQKNPAADRATATEQTPKATVEPLNLENLNVENLKRQLEKLGIGKFSASQETDIADSAKTQAKLSTDEQETELKQEAYLQLKTLLQKQKYPRAIALVEGLAHRMPSDAEISQWQAIVY
ncbi:MAG: J domain-containing protein, partial [Cyanobacteria bacterium J06598_3]